jgi:hypothetical protein
MEMNEINHTLYIDLDEIPYYTKLEIAEHQLERAIILFLDEKDYISAITLAGASEEILGKLLNQNKLENELDEIVSSFASHFGAGWEEHKKWLIEDANYHRNNLKHVKEGQDISIFPEAASEMIDRSIANYWKLTGKQSENMKRYYDAR